MEYTAQAASPVVSGEVKITVGDKALIVSALFDVAEIPFAEIYSLEIADYAVTVRADSGEYVFSRLGNWLQPFYDTLFDAYNKAVLRAFFIKGEPFLTAKGNYRYMEDGVSGGCAAPVNVYGNCVAALPPDLSARRVPLCFVNGMDRGDYELTLKIDTGESYTFSKLGYDTAILADAVEKHIRKLREESLSAVKEIDPLLTVAQSSQIAKLTPRGAAAPIGQLAGIAASFTAALEGKISNTRAADSYAVFKKLCGPDKIWIGFRKNEETEGADNGETEDAEADPYLIWLIAPSPDGRHAAVEFAEADSATFVYSTNGDFDSFARRLNHALEAIDFKREVIRLSDAELRKPENADYYMAAKRTAALQFVRSNFTGRVIHSSPEAWQRKLTELWSAAAPGKLR